MRFLLLILLVVLAVWLIRRALQRPERETRAAKPDQTQGDLVSCAHCGVHLPRSEARLAAGALYCSDEHARLGPGPR